MNGPTWHLERRLARLTGRDFTATLSAQSPHDGLTHWHVAGHPHDGHIQQVIFSPDGSVAPVTLQDVYLRGTDLIANYAEAEGRPFRAQVYWRAVPPIDNPPALAAVDTMVSVETSCLESQPTVWLSTNLPAENLCDLGGAPWPPGRGRSPAAHESRAAGCVLFRLVGGALSCAVLGPPPPASDLIVTCGDHDECRATHRLFTHPLEKGVIVRAGVRMVLVDRADDVAVASAWHRAMEGEPLPLTA